MPDYNPWGDPVFPQGAAFGTGSPAETSQQPAGLSNVMSGIYNALGDISKRVMGNSQFALDTGTYDPGPTLEAATLPMGTGAIAGVPVRAGEAVMGAGPIRAYHGSPHDFDAFSLDKIGTGEGAQAYGHGLYFADNPAVAQDYRETLGMNQRKWLVDNDVVGQYGQSNGPIGTAAARLRKIMGEDGTATAEHVAAAKADLLRVAANNPGLIRDIPKQLEAMDNMVGRNVSQDAGGKMYEVNINADPAHFLDWDKPLSEQPQTVKDAFAKQIEQFGPDAKVQAQMMIAGSRHPRGLQGFTKDLADQGIPGIKYLDQGSRGAGEGSRNYVVFNDKLIDIMRKYAVPGMFGGAMGAPIFAGDKQ